MSDARYQLVKELFLRARYLDREAREAYLDDACRDDADLRHEVESLLAHHVEKTVLKADADGARGTVPLPDDVPSSLRRETGATSGGAGRLARLVGAARRRKGRLGVGALVLALLLAFEAWTIARVQASLDELLAHQLQTVNDASVMALRQWAAAVQGDAQSWAARPDVAEAAAALAEAGDDGADAEALRASGHLERLITTLAAAVRHPEDVETPDGERALEDRHAHLTHRRFDGFGLVSPGGRVLGGHVPGNPSQEGLGEPVSERGRELLERVLAGETVLVPPELPNERRRFIPALGLPVMAVCTPVAAAAGRPAAMLAFLVEPSEEYAAILEVGRIGETGETYTFDERGLLLSESAFVDQLREIGLLGPDETSAVLRVHLRDPEADLFAGETPTALADRPRTTMAAAAIDEKRPGVDVSGSWTWIDELGMGVATEIDLQEGHRTLASLRTSMHVLFWSVVLLAGWLVFSTGRNLELQAHVDRARQYGDYHVVKVLGEGGIGTVYLAEHRMFARPAAVKVLRADRVTPQARARFQQEVQLTSQLTNPHTVEIYDFGRTSSGEFYYAMEYLPGLTLKELVDRYGAVPQERAVHLVRQICESLAEAHDLGMAHRDIKPMNVLVCARGGDWDVVKVLDFGLVKDLEAPAELQVTQSEEVTGSPLYMSPERFEAPLTVDARADIWAVGCVLYYLLAGRDPFRARTVMEVWQAVVNDDPRPLAASAPTEVHPEVEALVNRCLAKDRDARPGSVHEVLSSIGALDLRPWGRREARRWWGERADELPGPPAVVRRGAPVQT